MDRPHKMDDESMVQSAREESLSIPIGPMTHSRAKKLKEAIGGLLKRSLEQEEGLGRGLISQDTLTIVQSIPSS
ncbi:hypothetical protein Bca4012_063634 [Brassica carinata]